MKTWYVGAAKRQQYDMVRTRLEGNRFMRVSSTRATGDRVVTRWNMAEHEWDWQKDEEFGFIIASKNDGSQIIDLVIEEDVYPSITIFEATSYTGWDGVFYESLPQQIDLESSKEALVERINERRKDQE